jgi:hypothetical protein
VEWEVLPIAISQTNKENISSNNKLNSSYYIKYNMNRINEKPKYSLCYVR